MADREGEGKRKREVGGEGERGREKGGKEGESESPRRDDQPMAMSATRRTSASTVAKQVFLNWSNVPSDFTLFRTASAEGSGPSCSMPAGPPLFAFFPEYSAKRVNIHVTDEYD